MGMQAMMAMENPDHAAPQIPKVVCWNIGLKACDAFFDVHGRVPGCAKEGWEKDKELLKDITKKLYAPLERTEDPLVCDELVRYGGCEIHNIAALIGGIAS